MRMITGAAWTTVSYSPVSQRVFVQLWSMECMKMQVHYIYQIAISLPFLILFIV